MSQIDSIKQLLNLKDSNLDFEPKVQKRVIKSVKYSLLTAHLSYSLTVCPACHVRGNMVKNGYAKTLITVPNVFNFPTKIRLFKQRLLCKNCGNSVTCQSPLVDKYCFISNLTYHQIAQELTEDNSQKNIAKHANVSASVVNRILNRYSDQFWPNTYLPQNLSFDEFRGVNNDYNFICIDADTHKILTILPGRTKREIYDYFEHFSLTQRQQVKSVTVDLNAYYIDLIHPLFPNADGIIDRFHLIGLFNTALNQYRKQLQSSYSKKSIEYRVLKYHWRLFLKDEKDLNRKSPRWYPHLKNWETQQAVVNLGLATNKTFETTYHTYQLAQSAIDERNPAIIETLISNYQPLGNAMDTVIETVKKRQLAVKNALKFSYSNGPIEGINRKIKQINRTGFGHRNRHNFITRIRIEFNIKVQ